MQQSDCLLLKILPKIELIDSYSINCARRKTGLNTSKTVELYLINFYLIGTSQS